MKGLYTYIDGSKCEIVTEPIIEPETCRREYNLVTVGCRRLKDDAFVTIELHNIGKVFHEPE